MTLALIIWIGYALGALLTFRPLFRAMILDLCSDYNKVDVPHIVACTAFSTLIVAFVWWLVAPYLLLQRFVGGNAGSVARVIGGESRDMKVKRLEKEAREHERHINELERELEIGPYAGN